ncbi:MAG: ribosome silencing factor [Verrucomicrobia bacterium]|nr:ribosome silencing factor [Verrucomicrobiota bacterium]
MSVPATKPATTLPVHLERCYHALDARKGEDLRILYVGDVSSITDYFVLATGTSRPHLKALAEAAREALEEAGEEVRLGGVGDESGWAVVDAYDVMVHIFTAETRDYFALETLWKDGQFLHPDA